MIKKKKEKEITLIEGLKRLIDRQQEEGKKEETQKKKEIEELFR